MKNRAIQILFSALLALSILAVAASAQDTKKSSVPPRKTKEASSQAQNWPQFRGPRAIGVMDGKPTAASWNIEKGENVLWKTPIPGLSVSSPIVWGDRLIAVTAISSDPTPNSVTACMVM